MDSIPGSLTEKQNKIKQQQQNKERRMREEGEEGE